MAFVFCLSPGGGQNFLSLSPGMLGRVTYVRVFATSLFAQRRVRNASDTRVIGEEAQESLGTRKMIGEAHPTLPPSCLVCAQMFIERERRLCTGQPMKCVTRIENYELKKTSP